MFTLILMRSVREEGIAKKRSKFRGIWIGDGLPVCLDRFLGIGKAQVCLREWPVDTWVSAYSSGILSEFDLEYGFGRYGRDNPEGFLDVLGRFCGKRKRPKVLVFVTEVGRSEELEAVWDWINRKYVRRGVVYVMEKELAMAAQLTGLKELKGMDFCVGGSLTGLDRTTFWMEVVEP
ncbi:hypothetical protein O3Q51_00490 [Cryomorphaceae bacterium 1068]|nr:hypothetical protein [Cryomorphaceae bacterium 1068]